MTVGMLDDELRLSGVLQSANRAQGVYTWQHDDVLDAVRTGGRNVDDQVAVAVEDHDARSGCDGEVLVVVDHHSVELQAVGVADDVCSVVGCFARSSCSVRLPVCSRKPTSSMARKASTSFFVSIVMVPIVALQMLVNSWMLAYRMHLLCRRNGWPAPMRVT